MKKLAFKSIFDSARKYATLETAIGVIIVITVVAVTYNTSSVILQNYKLSKQVREAEQKVAIAEIELENQRLKNQYYQTDDFAELAARRQLSKGMEGEKLIIVPKSVALSKVGSLEPPDQLAEEASGNQELSNPQKWFKFLNGELEFVDNIDR